MCRTKCALALVALCLGLAQSWDIAVGVGDQLTFYTNGTKTDSVTFHSRNLMALAYDEMQNRMLYVDKKGNNDAICGFNLHSNENKCFIRRTGNIQGIAYDPPTQTLFFTDSYDNSINCVSLKPEDIDDITVNLLIKMNDRTPSDIAVDSCNGYIYWTNLNMRRNEMEYIERARFNGSQRQVLNGKHFLFNFEVSSLTIDPKSQKIYFIVLGPYISIKRAGLNGENLDIIHDYYNKNLGLRDTVELTVSKDYLYWVSKSNTLWKLPKNASYNHETPKEISTFSTKTPIAITANYKIEDQIQGLQNCEALSSLIPVRIESTTAQYTTEYVELSCVHGVYNRETSVCKCTPGFIGERCDVSICMNYCLPGTRNCTLNEDGIPICSCNAGYSGQRCEVYTCQGYCLNDGVCSLNEEGEPVCQCSANHEGLRCETNRHGSTTDTDTSAFDLLRRNVSLVDLLLRWRNPSPKMFLTVEL